MVYSQTKSLSNYINENIEFLSLYIYKCNSRLVSFFRWFNFESSIIKCTQLIIMWFIIHIIFFKFLQMVLSYCCSFKIFLCFSFCFFCIKIFKNNSRSSQVVLTFFQLVASHQKLISKSCTSSCTLAQIATKSGFEVLLVFFWSLRVTLLWCCLTIRIWISMYPLINFILIILASNNFIFSKVLLHFFLFVFNISWPMSRLMIHDLFILWSSHGL